MQDEMVQNEAKTSTGQAAPDETMIGMEPICEILETVFYSAHLQHSIPLSVMLIGPSGAGKSKAVMQYQHSVGCHVTTDVTSMGLQELLAKDTKGEINFIIIPDFNLVLSHRHSTLQLTIGNLLSMTSEGTVRIDDGRAVKETKHGPIGIVSAMTREMYAGIGKKWVALGFNRRFLPINYDYGIKTREQVQYSISNGFTTMLQLAEKKIIIPPHRLDVEISAKDAARLMAFSNDLAVNIGWVPINAHAKKRVSKRDGRGVKRQAQTPEEFAPRALFTGKQIEFSPHIVLRTLVRAHALREERKLVNEYDMDFIMRLIGFTRFDQPVML